MALRSFFKQVLKEEDELGKPLDRLDHQTKKVESIRGCYLLHLCRRWNQEFRDRNQATFIDQTFRTPLYLDAIASLDLGYEGQ